MASGFHLVFFLCSTSGLFITGSMSAADEKEDPCCPPNWTAFGSRCFTFYQMPKSWTDAEHVCISVGGNLVSVHSAEENAFLKTMIEKDSTKGSSIWIGGHDAVKEGTWLWSDGSKFNYKRWARGEPNNAGKEHCAVMYYGGEWNDRGCDHKTHFVCAKEK